MRCTEWFAGRGLDERPAIGRARMTVLAWRAWLLLAVVFIVMPLACSGRAGV